MRWFLGFLLILIGLILFGDTLNWWNQIDLASLWFYWPLLFIILGAAILVKRSRFGYPIMLLVILCSLGFVVYTGIIGEKMLSSSSSVVKTDIERVVPEGVKKARIIIDSAAIKVNISGSTDKLVSGNYESNFSQVTTEESISGETVEYIIKINKDNQNWNRGKLVSVLNLKLSNSIPIDLIMDAKASSLDLNLSEQKINLILIDSSASSIDLTLGNNIENEAKFTINSSASSLRVNVPKEMGVNFNVKSSLSSNNFSHLIQKNKNEYNTDNFTTATKKISFDINTSISSVNFNSY